MTTVTLSTTHNAPPHPGFMTYPGISERDVGSQHKRQLRVGMVLDQPFPPDARVEREAIALVEAGYEVHLLCVSRDPVILPAVPVEVPSPIEASTETDAEQSVPEASAYTETGPTVYQEPSDELYHGIQIHRINPKTVTVKLPFFAEPSRLPYTGLYKTLSRAIWNIDTAWHTLIRRFVERFEIDILHIHDLRLVNTGLAVASPAGIALVADLHENYPALMKMMKGKDNLAEGKRQFKKWEHLEQQCAWQADRVITVIEEARDRLIAKGIPANKLSVVPNTVDVAKFEAAGVNPDIVRRYKPYFLLTYVGNVNDTHRGIQTVLDAIALLKKDIPSLYFVAAGQVREAYYQALMQQAAALGIEHQIEFTGWMDETEFGSYIQASDICICPHLSNEQTEATFPNKLYLYHLFAKPVISSNCKPLARYINTTQGGVCYPAGNAQALAEQIKTLHKNSSLRRKLGDAGYEAVIKTHNWDKAKLRFLAVYDELAQGIQPRSYVGTLLNESTLKML